MNILSAADVEAIGEAIVNSSGKASVDLAKYARDQKRRYAESIDSVATLLRNGVIDEDLARSSVDALTASQTNILLTIKEMTKTEAAIAINAGLAAIGGIVNKAVGLPLLPV